MMLQGHWRNIGDSSAECAFCTCWSQIIGVGTSWRSAGIGGIRHVRNHMRPTDTLDLDLDATLAEGTSPAPAKLPSLRIRMGNVVLCGCARLRPGVNIRLGLSRRKRQWLGWLCERRHFRGMKYHIQLAGNEWLLKSRVKQPGQVEAELVFKQTNHRRTRKVIGLLVRETGHRQCRECDKR